MPNSTAGLNKSTGKNRISIEELASTWLNSFNINPFYEAIQRNGNHEAQMLVARLQQKLRPVLNSVARDVPKLSEAIAVTATAPLVPEQKKSLKERLEKEGILSLCRVIRYALKSVKNTDKKGKITIQSAEGLCNDLVTAVMIMHQDLRTYRSRIVDEGNKVLEEEAYGAMERVRKKSGADTAPDWIDFQQYLYDWLWLSPKNDTALTEGLQQLLAYLGFGSQQLQPYMIEHTENYKQRIKFIDVLKKIRRQFEQYCVRLADIEKDLKESLEGEELCQTIYLKMRKKTVSLSDKSRNFQGTEKERLALEQDLKAAATRLKTEEVKRNKHREDAIRALERYRTLYPPVTRPDGILDREDKVFAELRELDSYWQEELPLIERRKESISAMQKQADSANAGDQGTDILYRSVSEAELKSLDRNRAFCQGPSKTRLEREKWFFMKGASPGVSHAYLCTIILKPGALALLKSLRKPDGLHAAVVQKVAEPDCIGIHEDALPAFNALIDSVLVVVHGRNKTIAFTSSQHAAGMFSNRSSPDHPQTSAPESSMRLKP